MGRFPSDQHELANLSQEVLGRFGERPKVEVERLKEGVVGLHWRVELQSGGQGLGQGCRTRLKAPTT